LDPAVAGFADGPIFANLFFNLRNLRDIARYARKKKKHAKRSSRAERNKNVEIQFTGRLDARELRAGNNRRDNDDHRDGICGRFDEALTKIEDILALDPEFPEALFLEAQILWHGFEDADAAKQCLLKVFRVEPDKRAVFHRWALNLYGDVQKSTYFKEADIMENSIEK
jgi:hypothetical protein